MVAGLVFGENTQWSKDAIQLGNSLKALRALLDIDPFPENVPGLVVAISNKTEQVAGNLEDLELSLENELSSLDANDQQAALDAFAGLLVQVADVGEILANRGMEVEKGWIATSYMVSYISYQDFVGTFDRDGQIIPIYLTERGGWSIPG